MYLGKRAPGYLDDHRIGDAPLRTDIDGYRRLFEGADRRLLETMRPYRREWRWSMATIHNRWFESVDAELYYSVIRRYRPRTIVEIGSGHSTGFAFDAVRRNGRGRIICIDPEPRRSLPNGVDHIAARVQEVDLQIFQALHADDILFIDSSHTTDEARFHVERVLPLVAPGVLCQHHDFTFPWALYPGDHVAFAETDVLLEFYRENEDSFEVLTSGAYVRYSNPDLLPRLVPSYRWAKDRIPVSLWTQKRRALPPRGA